MISLIQKKTGYERQRIINAIFAGSCYCMILFGLLTIGYSQPNLDGIIHMVKSNTIERFNWTTILYVVLIPLVVLVWEYLVVGWKKSSLSRLLNKNSVSSRIDICCWFFFAFWSVGWVVAYIFTFSIFHQFGIAFRSIIDLQLLAYFTNPVANFILAFIVKDLTTYIIHRFEHAINFLWAGHSVHHSAEHLSVLTLLRNSPLSEQFANMVSAVPLAIFGASFESFILVVLLNQLQHYFNHTHLQWDWGFIGRWILVSPKHHQIHHSTDKKHQDKNFGSSLIIWDRIFGTYYEPKMDTSLENFTVGILEPNRNKSFLHEQLTAFCKFIYYFGLSVADTFLILFFLLQPLFKSSTKKYLSDKVKQNS